MSIKKILYLFPIVITGCIASAPDCELVVTEIEKEVFILSQKEKLKAIKDEHIEIFGEYDSEKVKKQLINGQWMSFSEGFYSRLGAYYLNKLITAGDHEFIKSEAHLIGKGVSISKADIIGIQPVAHAIRMKNIRFLNYLEKEHKSKLDKIEWYKDYKSCYSEA